MCRFLLQVVSCQIWGLSKIKKSINTIRVLISWQASSVHSFYLFTDYMKLKSSMAMRDLCNVSIETTNEIQKGHRCIHIPELPYLSINCSFMNETLWYRIIMWTHVNCAAVTFSYTAYEVYVTLHKRRTWFICWRARAHNPSMFFRCVTPPKALIIIIHILF